MALQTEYHLIAGATVQSVYPPELSAHREWLRWDTTVRSRSICTDSDCVLCLTTTSSLYERRRTKHSVVTRDMYGSGCCTCVIRGESVFSPSWREKTSFLIFSVRLSSGFASWSGLTTLVTSHKFSLRSDRERGGRVRVWGRERCSLALRTQDQVPNHVIETTVLGWQKEIYYGLITAQPNTWHQICCITMPWVSFMSSVAKTTCSLTQQ